MQPLKKPGDQPKRFRSQRRRDLVSPILGTSWITVGGLAGVRYLWLLLFHASLYASGFYYSVAWLFCLLYLTGAVTGLFLLCGAPWARRLIGCISALIVLGTVTALSAWGTIPAIHYVVAVLAAASLVLLLPICRKV